MKYKMIKEIKANIKMFKFIYIADLFFLAFWLFLGSNMMNFVYSGFRIPFYIGHAIIGFIVRAKSPYNCDKRIYQSMMILYNRDRICYEGVKDTNTKDNQIIKGTKDMYSNISHMYLG